MKEFHLGEEARIISGNIPGEKSLKLLKHQELNEGSIVSYPRKMPIGIRRAKGAIIEDVDGNRFIDFFAGAGVLNLGHCNPYILDRVKKQQDELIHILDFPTENKMMLIDKILEQLPVSERENYKVSFCAPTGSDAVEAAIKLAKIQTGREGVIAFHGSYHGMTSGALALTSDVSFRSKIKSIVPNVSFVPFSYCYRCPFNADRQSCNLECAEYLEYVLKNGHSGQVKPAAIILEPIQGEGGTVIPKRGYLNRIVEIAKENDVVVIFDEIQSGFYRTGDFWAFSQAEVLPDIITMSKGLGGVGFPISAIIYKKKIEAWEQGDHIGTFRGNQVSIAAGNAAIDFIQKYDIQNHVREMSIYLRSKLELIKADFPCVGDIRGVGLMIGIEYVKSSKSKKPDPEIVKKIRNICFVNGLIFEVGGHYSNVIRFLPPLIITPKIIDNAIEILRNAHVEIESNLLELPKSSPQYH